MPDAMLILAGFHRGRFVRSLHRYLEWFLDGGPTVVQTVLSLHALGLAYILHEPEPTFPTSRSYDWMAAVMTEDHWAFACLLAALVGFVGLLPNAKVRISAALASAAFIGVIAAGYHHSNPEGGGWWTYLMLVLLSGWLTAHRLWRNA